MDTSSFLFAMLRTRILVYEAISNVESGVNDPRVIRFRNPKIHHPGVANGMVAP